MTSPIRGRASTWGLVKSRVSAFEAEMDARRKRKCCPPNGDKKVVCYFTSVRAVRKTFDDCADIKTILRGYGVKVDERDVWLHKGFRDELGEIIGDASGQLPRVFVNCRYLGGAEEVRGMHEDGTLREAVEECEEEETVGTCEGCGDMRFVPCETCSGSHRMFVGAEAEGANNGFVECSACNENGLVRCTVC